MEDRERFCWMHPTESQMKKSFNIFHICIYSKSSLQSTNLNGQSWCWGNALLSTYIWLCTIPWMFGQCFWRGIQCFTDADPAGVGPKKLRQLAWRETNPKDTVTWTCFDRWADAGGNKQTNNNVWAQGHRGNFLEQFGHVKTWINKPVSYHWPNIDFCQPSLCIYGIKLATRFSTSEAIHVNFPCWKVIIPIIQSLECGIFVCKRISYSRQWRKSFPKSPSSGHDRKCSSMVWNYYLMTIMCFCIQISFGDFYIYQII